MKKLNIQTTDDGSPLNSYAQFFANLLEIEKLQPKHIQMIKDFGFNIEIPTSTPLTHPIPEGVIKIIKKRNNSYAR